MARSPEQVLDAHRKATLDADMAKLIALYADDAILITTEGACVGKAAIQELFEGDYESAPNVKLSFGKRIVEGDTCLLEWSSESDAGSIPQGVDTYIIQDGKIQRQTIWFSFVPKKA